MTATTQTYTAAFIDISITLWSAIFSYLVQIEHRGQNRATDLELHKY